MFSSGATSVELLLFEHPNDKHAASVVPITLAQGFVHYWHIFIPGLKAGQIYGYRVGGPWNPSTGHRFDSTKVLLDPYGRGVVIPPDYSRNLSGTAPMKSVVLDLSTYDWEDDAPLNRPCSQTVVYEMHVKGFTQHSSSGVSDKLRGTYAGLIEKIPYLKQLGISAVELLPVFQFDSKDAPPGQANYWGYAPISFFAPHCGYSSRQQLSGPADEFRDMVKALHRNGIEVILDVVFNHTSEGDERGPTLSYRGLANSTYYMLDADRSRYANYSGTGNTLNANHSVVRRLILDSLHFWVQEMHVDGFRFDLASILTRNSSGEPMSDPPVLWDIEFDPVLSNTKIIAEAWDAAGLYQVGSFIGDRWQEWNGRFRDEVRSFLRADPGSVTLIANRILGSPDIFGHEERKPEQSVNFVTCHDGFTLNDLVSYNFKHNEANGESNRDGAVDNRSWNCGVEGPTDDPIVEGTRNRQVKNFLTCTLLSIGMPMITMGDEVRRTQRGNNNAYCQDNETSWLNWNVGAQHSDVLRFVMLLIKRRMAQELNNGHEHQTLNQLLRASKKTWHGVTLNQPDWGDGSHSLACTLELGKEGIKLHVIFNAYWESLDFELPRTAGQHGWRRWVDTALNSPFDITEWGDAIPHPGETYHANARSVVVLYMEAESWLAPGIAQ